MYVSRTDGDVITYDIRMKKPNAGDYLPVPALHTLEHLFATFARNSEWADRVVYVGPMGCRTGCYILFAGDLESRDIVDIITRMFEFIRDFKGEIPGAAAHDCGNYLDHNLAMTQYEARKYL